MINKLFWFDIESTGLDSKKNDIIQLAYFIEINGKIIDEKNLYLQPFSYENIEQSALEVNKITIAQLKEFPLPQNVYGDLLRVLDKNIDKYNRNDKLSPAGYNVGFDVGFLKEFFFKNNNKYFGSYFDYHVCDILQMCFLLEHAGKIKLENYKLETVAKYLGINTEFHNALNDIKITRKIYYQLLEMIK